MVSDGRFLRADENLDQAAERVLRDCTGLGKNFIWEQLMTFSDVGLDPGARGVSAAYFALMDIRNYDKEAVRSSYNAAWVLLEQSASSDLRSQPDGYESFGAFEKTGDQLSGRFQPVTSGVYASFLYRCFTRRFSDVKSTNVISGRRSIA